MNAGPLDQRITLQQKATPAVKNDRGEDVTPWENVATVWASADPKRGSEFFAARQMQADGPVVFRIRWRSGVHERMRVLWRSIPHEIVAPPIDSHGKKDALELYCATGIRDGMEL